IERRCLFAEELTQTLPASRPRFVGRFFLKSFPLHDAGKKLLAERRIRPEILAGRITQEIDQQEDHFPECAIVHETFAPRLIPQGGICLSRKPDPAEAAAMSPELPPRMFAASLFHPKKVGIRA